MIRFVDAHIHLADQELQPVLSYLLTCLRSLPVTVCSVSTDLASSIRTLDIAHKLHRKIMPFIGVHPSSACNADLHEFEQFVTASHKNAFGIGEIGLDRKYVRTEDEYRQQREVFIRLLEISEKTRKPVSIHSRGTCNEVIDILSGFSLCGILLHWFSGDLHSLKKATDSGYYISFGPTIVYSTRTKTLASNTPRELILTETDGPVKYGVCFDGRMALPTFIPSVILALSSALRMSFHDVAALVNQNFKRYLYYNMQIDS